MISENRKYVAISIKHTQYKWKFGMPCTLWGYHQTDDNEKRCFSGYTAYLSKAERYALNELTEHYHGSPSMKDDEPVKISADLCKKYKYFDTVLVEYNQYKAYCEFFDLPMSPLEDN